MGIDPDHAYDMSVIIPCYNTEQFLDQAIETALANDRVQLEVIVLNDGSTDGSLACMRAWEARDQRVRVIDKKNQGYGATVNRGMREARGTYLAILEPDDYLMPHMYDDLVEYAQTFDTLPDIVKTPYVRVLMPTTPRERTYQCSYYGRGIPENTPMKLSQCSCLLQSHPSIWSALYRRRFLEDCHITFKEVPGAGWVDNPFLFETMCQAQSIVYKDTPYYCYREDLPGSSSVKRVSSLPFERWNDMFDVCDRLGVDDLAIRKALYTIGFRYIAGAIAEDTIDDPRIQPLVEQLFSRMDPVVILACEHVSPSARRMAFVLSKRSVPHLSRLPYFRGLVQEFFYVWRVNGFVFALTRFCTFVQQKTYKRNFANSMAKCASGGSN